MKWYNYIISFLILGLVACGHTEKKEKTYNINFPPELKKVDELIADGKIDDAKLKIDDYLNKSENIHWFGHAYFLKAFLFELQENFDESIKQYRNAIEHTSKYNSKVEAKALYNLSFVYERIGNMEKLLSTLLDLMKRRQYFDVLTGHVETPARLAAVYAQQGKIKEAFIFHREAANNFNQMVRRKAFRASKDEISKSLYYLGLAVFDAKKENSDDLIKKLNWGQKYFLGSAEASKSMWSEKASQRLLTNYNKVWEMIESFEPEELDHDPQAKNKQKQTQQLVLAADLYDLVHALRVEEFPLGNVNKRSKKIMNESEQWLIKLQKFAQNLDLGPDMIRDQPVKQRRLMVYVDKPKEKVRINKETAKLNKQEQPQESAAQEKTEENTEAEAEELPPKASGDPNL